MAAPAPTPTDIVSQISRLFSWPAVALAASDWAAGLKTNFWSAYVTQGALPASIRFAPSPAAPPAPPTVAGPLVGTNPAIGSILVSVPPYQAPSGPVNLIGQVF